LLKRLTVGFVILGISLFATLAGKTFHFVLLTTLPQPQTTIALL